MRVLLTGFEPFDGEPVNPSMVVAQRLGASPPAGSRLSVLVLPVERHRADAMLIEALDARHPDAVLMLGEAGGRACVTPERIAINVDDYRIPDNAGQQPREQPVVDGGPAGYFSTLPVAAMAARLERAGIPARVSCSAGTYLCNRVFYRVMHHLRGRAAAPRAGFVHLPYLHQQVLARRDAAPSMAPETLEHAVRLLIESLQEAA